MIRFFTTLEKVIISLLIIIIGATSTYLYFRFIRDNSEIIATEGGIYTEGVVGRPQFINPVLLVGNPVDKDLSQLIYSGLTRYNPDSGLIEDDIATSEKSKDNLTYTFRILADAKWHDGTPVTADDVVYTYESVIKNDAFKNGGLKQVFNDVKVEKVEEKVVKFKLSTPYSFFLSNVTLGILPKHLLEMIPVENMEKSEFNQNPIGTGPYKFGSWTVSNDTHELTLKRNEEYYGALPKVHTIIFRAFPDYNSLVVAENTLSGFRMASDQVSEKVVVDSSRFTALNYHLPQYSALFLNTDSDILSNKKIRFALLLATDKEKILEIIMNGQIVDTPILESKEDLDIEFSLERSRGAFFDTEWHLPGKKGGEGAGTDPSGLEALRGSKAGSEGGTGGPVDMALIDGAVDLKFKITAVQDSWLSFKLDNVAQRSVLLKSGESKEYSVKNSFTFQTIGNAAGISVTVNGLALKSFGGEGVVIRGLFLNRESLEGYIVESEGGSSESGVRSSEEIKKDLSTEKEDTEANKATETNEAPEANEAAEALEVPEANEATDEMDKVRINGEGKRLIIRLVTSQEQPLFLQVAEEIQKQWLEAGAKVVVETYSMIDLQEKIAKRDYDILLFGQNLGYNLDAFPFWHSSQSGNGLNLSNYKSLEADNLLVSIRNTFDERTKQEQLEKLKKLISEDTPAVFLYNPTHYYMIDKSVKNVQLGKLSNHSDRFADLNNWYLKDNYRLKEDFSLSLFTRWLFSW